MIFFELSIVSYHLLYRARNAGFRICTPTSGKDCFLTSHEEARKKADFNFGRLSPGRRDLLMYVTDVVRQQNSNQNQPVFIMGVVLAEIVYFGVFIRLA